MVRTAIIAWLSAVALCGQAQAQTSSNKKPPSIAKPTPNILRDTTGVDQPPPYVPPQQNNEVTEYGEAGLWKISIDNTMDSSCFAVAQSASGQYSIRIGMDPGGKMSGYVLVSSPKWVSLRQDMPYHVRLALDDKTWDANAVGHTFPNTRLNGLLMPFTNEDFWVDFGNSKGLKAYWNGKQLLSISLENSDEAVLKVLDCQIEVENWRDPFAGQPTKESDPFAEG